MIITYSDRKISPAPKRIEQPSRVAHWLNGFKGNGNKIVELTMKNVLFTNFPILSQFLLDMLNLQPISYSRYFNIHEVLDNIP